MGKRVLSAGLALCMVLALAAPALGEGKTRLTGVDMYVDGELAIQYTYTYGDGPLPAGGRMHELAERPLFRDGRYAEAVPPDTVYAYAYDRGGRMVRQETVIDDGTGSAGTTCWEYDADGRLQRDEWTSGMANSGGGTGYVYDGDGRLVRSVEEDEYGIGRYVDEYDWDEAGRVTACRVNFVTDWDEAGEPIEWNPVSESRYTYDESGRVVGERGFYDGAPDHETAYTYGEDRCFVVRYGKTQDYVNGTDESFCDFLLNDAAGKTVLCFSLPGTPTLVRDGEGRVVRAEAENRALEFSYEE